LLPTIEGKADLDDFFTIAPRTPDDKGLELANFLSQQAAVERASGRGTSLVLTGQPPEGDRVPVILDITVAEQMKADPNKWSKILESITALRDLKNRMFRNSLTAKCIELFQ
jgi:uncharacterized protein (TIGR04255 family)